MTEPAAASPWDRLPGESRQAYAAYCVYQDLPSNLRSIDRAYDESLKAQGRIKRSKRADGTWRSWSVKYAWPDRAAAHDHYLRQQADQAEAEEVRRTGRERARRREQVEESEWKARGRLLAAAEKMLEYPLETEEAVDDEPEEQADGSVLIIRRVIHRPVRWTFADVARFYEMASKLGRLSTGAETERSAVVQEDASESGARRAGGALIGRLQRALETADAGKRERLLEVYSRVLRDTRELEDALIGLETGAPPPRATLVAEEEEDAF